MTSARHAELKHHIERHGHVLESMALELLTAYEEMTSSCREWKERCERAEAELAGVNAQMGLLATKLDELGRAS